MDKFYLAEETLGYVSAPDESNIDSRLLVSGSQNVLIDYQKKVKIRSGYNRFGAANTGLTPVKNAWNWETSTGFKAPMRYYDDELEVYLGTVDGYKINAWKRVRNGWTSTEMLRMAAIYEGTTELEDLAVFVNGDDNLYAWNGAVAVVSSVTANTIKKKGTATFAENRFFASGNKTLINVRTGTEFTYTGGEGTTTLTGVSGSPVTDGMVAGDVLVQKMITSADTPAANRNNDTIYSFENQLVVGSNDDEIVYISKNTAYTDFTFSSPRTSGQGALLTLTDPMIGATSLGSDLIIFAGKSEIFKAEYMQLDVGGTLTETLKVKKLDVGVNQGLLNQECLVPIGNSVAYLTNETALRIVSDASEFGGLKPKTFSNPIKPDFDDEDWSNAQGIWYKNILYFSAPANSHIYMLNFMEDADGKVKRFWNPPQILPVRAFSIIDLDDGDGQKLYGHSNSVPESYLLFDGASDQQYDGMAVKDKIPIDAQAVFAYNNMDKKGVLKNFDEYYVEGEITPNTNDLICEIRYDYGGATQIIELTIDGSDEDILEGAIGYNSLAQQSLATNPMGGLLNTPEDTRRFRTVLEIAKEDFYERQIVFKTNDVDRYWAIITHGGNDKLSNRKNYNIKK